MRPIKLLLFLVPACVLDDCPTTVLIGADGKVAFYETGFDAQRLRDVLRAAGAW